MQKVSKEYINFLSDIDVVNNQNLLAELNKVKYDSLAVNNIFLVSLFAETMNCNNRELFTLNNIPIIQSDTTLYDASNVDYFITHNPYSAYYLSNLDQIHLLGYNICFGMFGKKYDSDKLQKLNTLKIFADSLNDQFQMYYETSDDCYFGCIKSQRKIKKLVKIK